MDANLTVTEVKEAKMTKRDAKRTRLLQQGWTAGRCWPQDGIEEWFAPNGDTYHLQWVPGATTYYAFNPMA